MLCYTVSSEFDDPAVADEYGKWLSGGHLAEVCAGGALDAELVRLDGEPPTIEVRYHFASREAFAEYEREHAPRLRAEGRALFPPERGVRMRRSVGTSVERVSR
jgi:hypothetical protein